MSLFTAALHPGAGVGFLVLGASLHEVLTRLKAEPQCFPKLDLGYSGSNPVMDPVVVNLPANGIRLRFDGPEQRLRLIEIIDFTKNRITYQEKEIAKPVSSQGGVSSPKPSGASGTGPTFKSIYHRLFGPTYDGEFIPSPTSASSFATGTYVLSYPGVAFNFALRKSAYSQKKDMVSFMSSSPNHTATSAAVFSGQSWAEARQTLWKEVLPSIKSTYLFSKSKEVVPDEVSLVKIHGGGRLQLFRKWTNLSTWINLGETTPQDLVIELGPPDAIYRKNDQRMHIHKTRTASHSRSRSSGGDYGRPDDLADTDQSSAHAGSDDSEDEAIEDESAGNVSGECFFNYFYMGFDILISTPQPTSQTPPSQAAALEGKEVPGANYIKSATADRLVATKVILHANVPGSYPFNRHRRCRWEIQYLAIDKPGNTTNSETPFNEIEKRLREEWKSTYASEEDAKKRQRGMVLNRGWGDSPGSSVEFLGGWEDSSGGVAAKKFDGNEDSTTTLYGFPGLVFEVLKNGFVSAVTVY
ncbi:hypothetical protein GGS26DRAFT_561006 [Hypomontagnella submonticulosa]|nr:hypothetical protein GGS26DRAFT_561006 [Hypomontagnella submonticulosa]